MIDLQDQNDWQREERTRIAIDETARALRKAMAPPAPLPNLGPLQGLYYDLEATTAPHDRLVSTLQNILVGIDSYVTASNYGGPVENDRPPNGDDFNDLWDCRDRRDPGRGGGVTMKRNYQKLCDEYNERAEHED